MTQIVTCTHQAVIVYDSIKNNLIDARKIALIEGCVILYETFKFFIYTTVLWNKVIVSGYMESEIGKEIAFCSLRSKDTLCS